MNKMNGILTGDYPTTELSFVVSTAREGHSRVHVSISLAFVDGVCRYPQEMLRFEWTVRVAGQRSYCSCQPNLLTILGIFPPSPSPILPSASDHCRLGPCDTLRIRGGAPDDVGSYCICCNFRSLSSWAGFA